MPTTITIYDPDEERDDDLQEAFVVTDSRTVDGRKRWRYSYLHFLPDSSEKWFRGNFSFDSEEDAKREGRKNMPEHNLKFGGSISRKGAALKAAQIEERVGPSLKNIQGMDEAETIKQAQLHYNTLRLTFFEETERLFGKSPRTLLDAAKLFDMSAVIGSERMQQAQTKFMEAWKMLEQLEALPGQHSEND